MDDFISISKCAKAALVLTLSALNCSAQTEASKVRIFLCDSEHAALAFALARSSPRATDDLASNVVNKEEGRKVCDRYIGYVVKEDESRKIFQGLLFKVTRYKLQFADNRGASEAWGAERLFDSSPMDVPQDL
jgi:hypothetical protein